MRFFLIILTMSLLIGCATAPTDTQLPISPPTNTVLPTTVISQPTERLYTPTTTVTPTQKAVATPSLTIVPSCVTLIYEENAQIELFSPRGYRVLVDVYDPGLLSKPATEEDILLTTHTHWDHVNDDFQLSFPGEQLMTQAGTIEAGDVTIQGIPSAHNAGDVLKSEGGTNYIYLIETGGLRIVHFGDIGQESLTAEQLDLLSKVDIAITQFANPYSDMNADNQKGIRLMQQVSPRLIIPTHVNLDSGYLAIALWQGLYADNPLITLCESNLADQPQILFLGQSVQQFVERLNLSQVDW